MASPLLKRIFAILIDVIVIILYAVLLLTLSVLIQKTGGRMYTALSPLYAQFIGFLTLTIPVFLYFFLSEKSSKRATIGKRLNKIQVTSAGQTKISIQQIFLRNFFKLLPWEIAHTGVYWVMYYSSREIDPPLWVFVLLIIPQLMILVYLVSMIITKGQGSVYDTLAKTKIIPQREV